MLNQLWNCILIIHKILRSLLHVIDHFVIIPRYHFLLTQWHRALIPANTTESTIFLVILIPTIKLLFLLLAAPKSKSQLMIKTSILARFVIFLPLHLFLLWKDLRSWDKIISLGTALCTIGCIQLKKKKKIIVLILAYFFLLFTSFFFYWGFFSSKYKYVLTLFHKKEEEFTELIELISHWYIVSSIFKSRYHFLVL